MKFSCEKTYQDPFIINNEKLSKVVKNFIELHSKNGLSIIITYKDDFNLAAFEYAEKVWSLLQSGKMWLEYNFVFTKLLLDDCLHGYWLI